MLILKIFLSLSSVQIVCKVLSAASRDTGFLLKGRPYTCACMNGFVLSVENANYCVLESSISEGKYKKLCSVGCTRKKITIHLWLPSSWLFILRCFVTLQEIPLQLTIYSHLRLGLCSRS